MIAITGATGHLGRHVIDHLLETVPADQVVAAVRSPEKAADLAERGVDVRYADYTEPSSLEAAFDGIDKLLLISASDIGKRVEQHRNVVDAALANGVDFMAYTSILNADDSQISLAEEHRSTEDYIRESGITHAFLRNGWYIENYTENLDSALEHGAIMGSAGDGRISAATREDYAVAAVAVLTSDGHDNAVYELAGDEAFTMEGLADAVSRHSGKDIAYRDMPAEEYEAVLKQVGMPEPVAHMLADADKGIRRGELYSESEDLRELIGRATTTLDEVLQERFE